MRGNLALDRSNHVWTSIVSNRCDRYRNAFRVAKRIKWHLCCVYVCVQCRHIRSLNCEVLYNVITMHWPMKLTPYCRTVHFQNDKWRLLFYLWLNWRICAIRIRVMSTTTGTQDRVTISVNQHHSSNHQHYAILCFSAKCIRRPLLRLHLCITENDSVRNASIHLTFSNRVFSRISFVSGYKWAMNKLNK